MSSTAFQVDQLIILKPDQLTAIVSKEGIHTKTIQDLFGHSSPSITDRYLPTHFEAMREAVKSLDERIEEVENVQ